MTSALLLGLSAPSLAQAPPAGSAAGENPAAAAGADPMSEPPPEVPADGAQAGISVNEQPIPPEALMDKTLIGEDGSEFGTVEDVILGSDGQPEQVVVSHGGFLGFGDKQVAIDIGNVNWQPGQDTVGLSGLTRQEVEAMPAFEYSDSMTSLRRQ
ncbi:PRC-barrel domain-containing protein [Azospirillum sp. SYSU D00513]|uniref:PRC-barrel domain-containing protein n=1 Tax=Azospirillum sp. SYSU D00513 TaxID=2812561 RepID=UPI001A96C603|nr:PRC-barrel domain-containing protein [Azospirillum sp. SYSU D00513]